MSRDIENVMSDIAHLLEDRVFFSLTQHLREKHAEPVDTGMTDSAGVPITTGHICQFWVIDGVEQFFTEEPKQHPQGKVLREVVVVDRNEKGIFLGVDYDVMEAGPLDTFAGKCVVLGHVNTDEGMQALHDGLQRFGAVVTS